MFDELDKQNLPLESANKNHVLEDIFSEAAKEQSGPDQLGLASNVNKQKPAAFSPIAQSPVAAMEIDAESNKKKKLVVLLILLIIVFAIVIGSLFFVFKMFSNKDEADPDNDYILEQNEKIKKDIFEETNVWEEDLEEQIVEDIEDNIMDEQPDIDLIPDAPLEDLYEENVILEEMAASSSETTQDIKLDTDGDGLTDFDEISIYQTDPLNPDTDGDGYLDGAEVEAGYSPLGPGILNN